MERNHSTAAGPGKAIVIIGVLLFVFGFVTWLGSVLIPYLMALGTLVFIPAALSRTYGLFLAGLFIQGTGLSILQTASNPYITILGPRESAAKRMAIGGGAVVPLLYGHLADLWSPAQVYGILLPCYYSLPFMH